MMFVFFCLRRNDHIQNQHCFTDGSLGGMLDGTQQTVELMSGMSLRKEFWASYLACKVSVGMVYFELNALDKSLQKDHKG